MGKATTTTSLNSPHLDGCECLWFVTREGGSAVDGGANDLLLPAVSPWLFVWPNKRRQRSTGSVSMSAFLRETWLGMPCCLPGHLRFLSCNWVAVIVAINLHRLLRQIAELVEWLPPSAMGRHNYAHLSACERSLCYLLLGNPWASIVKEGTTLWVEWECRNDNSCQLRFQLALAQRKETPWLTICTFVFRDHQAINARTGHYLVD